MVFLNVTGGTNHKSPEQQQQQPQTMTTTTMTMDSCHNDFIYKIVFDTYGRRMATCSADRFVKVWDLQDSGEWRLVAEWPAHRGPVTSLAFAHPEYGHILATSGSDHVNIWEEKTSTSTTVIPSSTNTHRPPTAATTTSVMSPPGHTAEAAANTSSSGSGGANAATVLSQGVPFPAAAGGGGIQTATTTTNNNNNNNSSSAANLPSRWMNRSSLTDARRATTCLEFAPRHWGLKLAVGSADGCVRIYEAHDIMNLAQWPLLATLQLAQSSTTTASGSNHQTASSASHHNNNHNTPPYVSSLSWCTGRFEPLTLVVAGSHQLAIYRYLEGSAHAWQPILQLDQLVTTSFLDVAWAPNVGRRYHYIAATCDDGVLKVYKLNRGGDLQSAAAKKDAATKSQHGLTLEWSQTLQQEQQQSPTTTGTTATTTRTASWNCQWNVTGTVLASSGDAGVIQLWKADPSAPPGTGKFYCVSTVPPPPTRGKNGTSPLQNNSTDNDAVMEEAY